jgi:hypothetical protein
LELPPGTDEARLSPADHAAGAALLKLWAEPQNHAGDLLGAWRMARDGALFSPWCAPESANIRRPAGDLAPPAVHRRAVAALKSIRSWEASWAALAPQP